MAGSDPPLGLILRKTESLLDLCSVSFAPIGCGDKSKEARKAAADESFAASPESPQPGVATDKVKASNFGASSIQIGSWKCFSIREEDIVAKFYYAKRKLIWEVLVGERKRKMEIQWGDITRLHASFPENDKELATFIVEVSKAPLFFMELEPRPRMHTSWQACEDFTGNAATLNRYHVLQVPSLLLRKHFPRLINVDERLWSISRVSSNAGDFWMGPPLQQQQTTTTTTSVAFPFEVMISESEAADDATGSNNVPWDTSSALSQISEYLFEETDGTLLSFHENSWLGDDHLLSFTTTDFDASTTTTTTTTTAGTAAGSASREILITRKSSAGDLRNNNGGLGFLQQWSL